ncbi:MAG: glycosyltransferase [Pseudomonadota bacterium]
MQSPDSICLVIFFEHNQQHLERCIRSAASFVDACLVVTNQQETPDAEHIHHWCEGKRIAFFNDVAKDNKNGFTNILTSASEFADLALVMHANEELMCLGPIPKLPTPIGMLEVSQVGFSELQSRLFSLRSGPRYHALDRLLPISAGGPMQTAWPAISIRTHSDGQSLAHRQLRADIKSAIQQRSKDLRLKLLQAKYWLTQDAPTAAKKIFKELINELKASHDGTELLWQSHYLLANVLLDEEQDESAQSHFEACFEIDDQRMEPLMRLAECYFEIQAYAQCRALCEVITQSEGRPDGAYFEPDIYKYSARLLLAEALLAEGETGDALALARKIKNDIMLAGEADQRLQKLLQTPEKHKPLAGTESPIKMEAKPGKAGPTPVLSIGMATFDDFDGVYFSVMSILLYHPEVLDEIEIIVVDNNPDSAHGIEVKKFCAPLEQVRYISAGEYKTTSIKERVAIEARGDYVMVIDCHVFMHRGSLRQLIDYFQAAPDCTDLLHGPMVGENGKGVTTHMDPRWNTGFFGVFESDPRGKDPGNEPFDIPGHGMAMFAFRKSVWPGYNVKFRGFGGEEGYINEKFRQAGGRVLCVPFLRWTHRFPRPGGTKYINRWEDRIRNYLIGWDELGMDISEVLTHFSQYLGRDKTAAVFRDYQREVNGPFWRFEQVFCLTESEDDWLRIHQHLFELAVERITQKIDVVDNGSASRIEVQKQLVSQSYKADSPDIVLIDARKNFAEGAKRSLHNGLEQLDDQAWDALCFYGLENSEPPRVTELGIVIRNSAYEHVLSMLQDGHELSGEALRTHRPALVVRDL